MINTDNQAIPVLDRSAYHPEEAFARDGFAGPYPILSTAECDALIDHLTSRTLPAPLDWPKGRAATDRVLYEIAAAPRLIALLRPLLGEDIILWSAHVRRLVPGSHHPWHTDMESAATGSRAVSAWIGLRNTSRESGLRFVAGSHRFGRSVQEVTATLNLHRDAMTDAAVADAAQRIDQSARILEPDVSDGEALLFDGSIWHGGRNVGTRGVRTALLLQYAAADTPILMPVTRGYEWPFRYTTSPRVPAILV
ncbi:MAG: phytanoyl-CoA dioxygenase family protein, partial [Dongiaceae bacterium]